jgi:hypothetical protein
MVRTARRNGSFSRLVRPDTFAGRTGGLLITPVPSMPRHPPATVARGSVWVLARPARDVSL